MIYVGSKSRRERYRMSKNKNWWEYKSSSKEREILDALDPTHIDPESGKEVGTPWHLRAVELRDVSTKKMQIC